MFIDPFNIIFIAHQCIVRLEIFFGVVYQNGSYVQIVDLVTNINSKNVFEFFKF